MGHDEISGDRQAEPRPGRARRLDKAIEDPRQDLGRDATAGVSDGDDDLALAHGIAPGVAPNGRDGTVTTTTTARVHVGVNRDRAP